MKALVLWCMLAGTGRPDLDTTIQRLGDPDAAVRAQAQEILKSEADQRPRFMIQRLARAYARTEDLEIEARLESLLSELAREWMFYHPTGFLGVNFQLIHLGDDDLAVEIMQVIPKGAAERAGLKAQDRILEINGIDIGDMEGQEAFADHISAIRPGAPVELVIQRGEETFALIFPLGMRAVEHLDVARASREEERKLSAWLADLRGSSASDPHRPLGHFRVTDPEE